MHVILKRKLNNYEVWKKVILEMDGLRKQYGSKGAMFYRSAKNPSEVYLIFEWEDSKPFKNYLDLPDVKKAVADTGTIEIIEVSEAFHLAE